MLLYLNTIFSKRQINLQKLINLKVLLSEIILSPFQHTSTKGIINFDLQRNQTGNKCSICPLPSLYKKYLSIVGIIIIKMSSVELFVDC